jgi:zinc-ribbon domain
VYCMMCGCQLPDGANFCLQCGAAQKPDSATSQPSTTSERELSRVDTGRFGVVVVTNRRVRWKNASGDQQVLLDQIVSVTEQTGVLNKMIWLELGGSQRQLIRCRSRDKVRELAAAIRRAQAQSL